MGRTRFRCSAHPPICVLVHVAEPPIGFPDTYSDAVPLTPAHSAVDGQDILVSEVTFADDQGPLGGSVEVLTSPNWLDATQNAADAHDISIESVGSPEST